MRKEDIAINTFGNRKSKIQSIDVVPVKFILKDRVLEIECLSASFICAEILHQNVKQVSCTYSHLKNSVLADSSPKSTKNIDILIGAEHYYRFIFGNVNEPIAIESVFGWVLNGYYESIFSSNNFSKTHLMRINTEVCDTLTEETNFNSMKTLSEDRFDSKIDIENQCLHRFKNTLYYDGARYTSKLPFIKNSKLLPDNYILTKHRTDNLLKNLRKHPELPKEYDGIISDYIKEGIL